MQMLPVAKVSVQSDEPTEAGAGTAGVPQSPVTLVSEICRQQKQKKKSLEVHAPVSRAR